MQLNLLFSIFLHVVIVSTALFLPDDLFDKKPDIIAQNRVILDVELVVDRGKTAEKQQIKQPKKLVNQKKTPAPQPKKVEPEKQQPKTTTAKKVEKKAPVQKQAVQKVAPKKSVEPQTKTAPQNTSKAVKKDVINTQKLLETKDKTTPQISDKQAEKSTKIYTDTAKPKKIINDVKQTGTKSKTEQILTENIDVDALSTQIGNRLGACWSVPAGVPNAKNLSVKLNIKYELDGTVQAARVIKTSRSKTTPGMEQMIDAALRAVQKPECNPIMLEDADATDLINRKSYEKWQEIDFTFDPKVLLQ